ncbi:unnamed protein product [Fusarium equiseti]|uniref:Uncharacterized protein n=1 Tax=Fusarium equiseti TaxID=61235 RepID=A0A8J2IZR7_FUSEQ|nr:unnamed protein product [Fusarium equiseti]
MALSPPDPIPDLDESMIIPGLDESVAVPTKGFLNSGVQLPAYGTEHAVNIMSNPQYVVLTISDVLLTIRQDLTLARCILFETARIKRSLFSLGPLRLSEDARAVDIKLILLSHVLDQGDQLIKVQKEPRNNNEDALCPEEESAIKGDRFQKALRTAKKSLLELEKRLNDKALTELKKGMKRKGSVDYEQLARSIEHMKKEATYIYNKLKTIYDEEVRAHGGSPVYGGGRRRELRRELRQPLGRDEPVWESIETQY